MISLHVFIGTCSPDLGLPKLRCSHHTAGYRSRLHTNKDCSDLEKLKQVHANAVKSGHHSVIYIANSLINLYARCGRMVDARALFEAMPYRTVGSWTALILGYAKNGEGKLGLQMFAHMRLEGCPPDALAFVASLKACMSIIQAEEVNVTRVRAMCLEKVIAICSEAAWMDYVSHIFVSSTLVDVYAKCGSMMHSREIFDKITRPCVVSWTALILGYANLGDGRTALQLFAHMLCEGCVPDDRTFVAALKSCTVFAEEEIEPNRKHTCLQKGMSIHFEITRIGYDSDHFVASTLVDMYAACGRMTHAHAVFNKVLCPDVVLWNALILGYAVNGKGKLALHSFACMRLEGCVADSRTFVAVLKACTVLVELAGKLEREYYLQKGLMIHAEVTSRGSETNVFVASTLLDLYAKCKALIQARSIFNKIRFPDVVCWNALMLGYANDGDGASVLHLFSCMRVEGCVPDCLSFVAVLKACIILTAGEEGQEIGGKLLKKNSLHRAMGFHSEATNFGYDSQIFVASALVDLYAKCGSMVQARAVFDRMTHHDVVSWNTLMLGYSKQGNEVLALQLFERMQFEGCAPNDRTYYALLT